MIRRPSLVAIAVALAAATGIIFSTGITGIGALGRQPDLNGISPEALAQIDALMQAKEARTPAERKIDSQLLYAMRMKQGLPIAPGVLTQEVDLPSADDGHVTVDVKATATPSLLAHVNALTGESKPFPGDVMQLHIALDQLTDLAADPDVQFIQPPQGYMLQRAAVPAQHAGVPPRTPRTRAARRAALLDSLRQVLRRSQDNGAAQQSPLFQRPGDGSDFQIGTGVGNVISQADVAHRSAVYRGLTGNRGAGIKIGVLSDGVNNLAVSQASGDLGNVTVLPSAAGNGDEGTAMLELIHDIAPDAQLYFASALPSITQFATNIRSLRTAGCHIIVDDVFYFVETPFQDGQAVSVVSNTNGGAVIQAVKDVVASGALYFSSAGNSGNLNDATSGVWEGDFSDGGATSAPLPAGNVHNFAPATPFNTFTVPGLLNTLYWSDPLGGSANDYDLFRLNAAGSAVTASSTNVQNGTQDPYEQVSPSATDNRLVIVKKAGAASRFLHLNTNRGRLSTSTTGQTHGHSATNDVGAFGVAAVNAGSSFPNPFTTSNVVETFSSDGPRRLFYNNAGTPFTPGNLSSTGGLVLQKPDLAAADGVTVNGSGGFSSPFFGTSAAAPNAAALAALIKSANPGFTAAQIRSALQASALDIEAPGVDRDSGFGIVMAQAAQAGCTFTLSGTVGVPAGPSSGSVTVGASTGTCNWVLWSGVNWITFPSGAVGTGGGSVTYNVATNPGPARQGVITVQGGQTITITQAANATVPLVFSNNTPTPIADNATTNVTQTVAGVTAPITEVVVSFYLTHTFDSDLLISLIGPDGTTVPLSSKRGGSGDNYGSACTPTTSRTTFNDDSNAHVVQSGAPFIGTFRPEKPLAAFKGKNGAAVNGTWTLRVQDAFATDAGTLQCWTLNFWTGGSQISADFDGDVKSDMAVYKANGDWAILKSSTGFASSLVKNWGGAGYTAVPADYDGDGVQDMGLYRESTGDWYVLKSSTNFTTLFAINWGGTGYKPVPGDYDGDGKADPAVYNQATGMWSALRSVDSYGTVLGVGWGGTGYTPVPGQDFDGDTRADIAIYQASTGTWSILKSSTNYTTVISAVLGGGTFVLVPGDYDGDRRADIAIYDRSSGFWSIRPSLTNYATILNYGWGGAGYLPVPGDFDGDKRIDLAAFQVSTGNWYVLTSMSDYTASFLVSGWGSGSDLPLSSAISPGGSDTTRATDYDGDVKAEITVYNNSTGIWSILKSSTNYTTTLGVGLGGSGYNPVPGDYDGDLKADIAVYNIFTGIWTISTSSSNYTSGFTKSDGGSGWAAVPADYDGDGKTDPASYNTSTGLWYVLKSAENYTTGTISISWGGSGYIPQPADFDGDGKADLAVYQSATGAWSVLLSSTNYTTTLSRSVGGSGYLPVAADYDGDGRADFVVYHMNTGLWYGLKSSTNYTTVLSVNWGGTGYHAVRGDYDGDGRTDLAVYHAASGNWSILLSSANYTTVLSKNWGGAGYTAVPPYMSP